ncbi:hypothetical protein PAXRUDRAFT_830124 [Paxillus rubicundulus Ve08.2h10]|uniref:Uncharacterized protein n=1 Tax=Paxillus rubicundulus Ve08.2h10 TaxID=930991 RepID=A0A0D0DZ89_9AGAM|nr:hypothetical protein PAXRUDRAFT_830124 [Paxillus rubicundulus Ve08.2h10]
MATPNAPSKDLPVEEPVGSQSPVNGAQQGKVEEVSVEITGTRLRSHVPFPLRPRG